MRPTRIEGADARPLGAPEEWNEAKSGHVGDLFVRREEIEGIPFMRSAWEVEAAEAMKLFSGARLVLGVSGQVHPVVHLMVDDLPPDFEPTVTARRFTSPDGHPWVRVEMMFPGGPSGYRRAYCEQHIDGTLGDAVGVAIVRIEALARRHGWTPA